MTGQPTPVSGEVLSDASRGSLTTTDDVACDASSGPAATSGSSTGDTSPCADCFGHGQPCAACVAVAGDPRPEEFAVGERGAGGLVEGTRRCSCGRVYGIDYAGRHLCFVMEAPGRRQVERCVRRGVQLHAPSTEDCRPAAVATAVARGGSAVDVRVA
jgi:hypothetical protein